MELDRKAAYEFARKHSLAVLATVSADDTPEAALIEIAVTPELEIVFDTIDVTRKCANLRRNPHVSFVLGWDSAETLQYEGVADEPQDAELERIKKFYFDACPGGLRREGWPGLTYFRVRPTWLRFSNYQRPRHVAELTIPRPAPPSQQKQKKKRWFFA